MKKILLLLLLPIITFAQKEVIIHIKTDTYPGETKWALYKDAYQGDTIDYVDYGHYTQQNFMHRDTVYMADSITDISFVIFDGYGDGITNGEYYVTICGDTVVNYPVSTFSTGLVHNRTVPQCMPNPPPVQLVPAKVIINLDQYQSETSWDIKDTNGITYATGGGYNTQPDYATVVIPVQIPKGPLVFTIYDTYGDGLNGALWQGQDGSYFVKQCNDTLIYGTDPAFGTDTSHIFMSDSCPPILGCTDDDYVEWNPFADVDDGSCQTLKIFGCVDSTMFNYDPNANTMELIDTCEYTLILHDLMGNGWVGSHLKLIHPDTSYQFTHTGGFTDEYQVGLTAPDPITFKFHISSQASLTTIECGFTFINPEGDTLISIMPPFIQPLLPYNIITNCGNTCEEKVFGCLDSLAINYNDEANTEDSSCYYTPGCMNSSYLEYYTQGYTADYDDGTCSTVAVWGCTDSTAFNYDSTANIDNGGCVSVIFGCMQPLAFNYNPNANVDDGSCVPYIYGCTDPTMFNFDPNANTDDGSCVPFVFGCTDSTMFNFNPLANADNNSCIPYIYGCTDPSMLNYNPEANTENFSCIPYIYGCTDSTAFNYDSMANTDNGSCIAVVQGCMDPNAWNYNPLANINHGHDSLGCLYAAEWCINGSGNPFFLNDECYAWVIEVDEYCCENEWDEICELTYDHCAEGMPMPPARVTEKKLLRITDLLGREVKEIKNQVLLYIYEDGTIERKIIK
tara:strand:- start:396 stop:2603 length:2208 start_codon:yes stop_codon:yes gene_type:complete